VTGRQRPDGSAAGTFSRTPTADDPWRLNPAATADFDELTQMAVVGELSEMA
jgi:hypothetical protein